MEGIDKRALSCLDGEFPVCSRPFQVLAAEAGLTELQLLTTMEVLTDRGAVRRFGAALRHRTLGFTANAMVVWQVPDNRIEEIGSMLAQFPEITHCYHRRPAPDWPYNLYTMIHATSRAECQRIIDRAAQAAGQDQYLVLFSTEELKKTSLKYFNFI